jgi:nuclear protein localization protein 4 homolog
MLIRVRSNVGLWRVDGLNEETSTVNDILSGIAATRPHVVYEQALSEDPACKQPLDTTKSLAALGLRHGSLVHCRVDPASCADITPKPMDTEASSPTANNASAPTAAGAGGANLNMKRVIDKDGSIKLVPSTEIRNDKDDRGFRKGMLPLRDMKMAWTLNEFMALDAQFEFKIKRQEQAICNQVSLDSPAVHDFQSHLQAFQFARKRMGYMYGHFQESDDGTKKAIVEAIYEPPQQVDSEAAEGFELLDDPMEDTVEQIAQMCGMKKVGWIFGHPPRDKGYVLSAAEIIMAAELQLEAASGVEETPFCTVKVTMGKDGNISVEAFQVSQQCMAMVAEEALELGIDPGFCAVNETFTAIQEGKGSKTVNNNFFLCVVPIVQHTSDIFVSQFPKMNRDLDERTPSQDELKKQLSKSGTAGWTYVDLLSDFNLLIYLSKFLDVNADFPKITQSVVDRDVPLDDGYKIIIASIAGLDGAY